MKELKLIELIIPTIKCNGSTQAEKKSAQSAVTKQIKKVMVKLGYNVGSTDSMIACKLFSRLLENKSIGVGKQNEQKLNVIINMLEQCKINYSRKDLDSRIVIAIN